jgi:hypothetical protein
MLFGEPAYRLNVASARVVRIIDDDEKSRPLPGVTKVIKRYLARGCNHADLSKKPTNVGGKSYRQARARGKQVDAAMSQWCASSKFRPRLPAIKAIRSYIDEILFCDPVTTQLAVANPVANVATRLDLVIRHRDTGALTVVELKYGCIYRDCAMKTPKFMHTTIDSSSDATSRVPLTFRRIHELQAIMGAQMFNMTYPECNARAMLIYVTEEGVIDATSQQDMGVLELSQAAWKHVAKCEKSRIDRKKSVKRKRTKKKTTKRKRKRSSKKTKKRTKRKKKIKKN